MSHRATYTEEQMLLRISMGDHAAFRVLYNQHRNRIYSYALQLTNSDQVANDVVQEVFTHVWQSREHLAAVNDVTAYLTTIARNEFFKVYRQQLKQRQLIRNLPEADNMHSGEQDYYAKEQEEHLRAAINRLPPQQRRIYELSRHQGMKPADIAEELGLSVNTVKVHLARALNTLRKAMNDYSGSTLLIFYFLPV